VTEQQHLDLPQGPSGAILSDDGLYRYLLWRVWDGTLTDVLWIMLNPSTADASVNDATIRKCIGFAKRWGFGAIEVVNLFAFRATKPRALVDGLQRGLEIVGQCNNANILAALKRERNTIVVAAWGTTGRDFTAMRAFEVAQMAESEERKLLCLGKTKHGAPRHPLMVPYSQPLENYL